MNIKLMLVEKEREAYVRGDTKLAQFFSNVLEYVVEKEDEVNEKDAEKEEMSNKIKHVEEAVRRALTSIEEI